jgi:hypothetical protein
MYHFSSPVRVRKWELNLKNWSEIHFLILHFQDSSTSKILEKVDGYVLIAMLQKSAERSSPGICDAILEKAPKCWHLAAMMDGWPPLWRKRNDRHLKRCLTSCTINCSYYHWKKATWYKGQWLFHNRNTFFKKWPWWCWIKICKTRTDKTSHLWIQTWPYCLLSVSYVFSVDNIPDTFTRIISVP